MDIQEDDVHGFIKSSHRFKSGNSERHFWFLNEDGSDIGSVWFKHLLGGWRMRLHSDIDREWEERGAIITISKMKTFL